MSIWVMSQVWEADLPSGEKFVLLALADHARDDGSRVYPSIATVARKTGFSDRTVQRCMRILQAKGILSIVKKSVRYGTTEYLIRGDKLTPLTVIRGDKHAAQRCHIRPSGVTNTTPRGDTVSPESLENHQLTITQPAVKCVSDSEKRFEIFWALFPARDGKKAGRDKAKGLFMQLSSEDQALLIEAARAYAVTDAVQRGIGILDPANFIRRRDRDTGEISEPWRTWAAAGMPSPSSHNFAEQDRDREIARQEREARARGELPPLVISRPFGNVQNDIIRDLDEASARVAAERDAGIKRPPRPACFDNNL